MKKLQLVILISILVITTGYVFVAFAAPKIQGLLPDLQTVVPQHLGIVNEHQREILRFSNGIANTGDGPWRMRPEFPSLPREVLVWKFYFTFREFPLSAAVPMADS